MAGFHAVAPLGSITTPVNVIQGTSEGEVLVGTAGRDALFGEDGDDVLYAYESDDHLSGGKGNDTLYANEGNDKLFGDAGDDHLYGHEGNDRLAGGDGNDALNAYDGNDWMSGDGGQDQIYGGPGRNTILGGTSRDFAIGAGGDDDIFGGADADWLSGGLGHDTTAGGAGNDLLGGGDGSDRLLGEAGRDTIHGGLGRDDLWGGAGDDDLRGGWDKDRILGEAGNDRLFGERGNDRLSGGSGNDTLYGDGGPDYTLQARIVVPVSDPGFLRPREMILTDGETLVVRNGMSELLTYDVDTQHLLGQFTPLAQGRLLDVSLSDELILVGSPQRGGTSETPLARIYDPTGHVLLDLTNPNPSDLGFGTRVALDNDHAVVVSDQAAYVFHAGNGRLEHAIPLPPSPYGPGWPPLDVELSGDTIAIHAGADEGEEIYVLNADAGTFVRQIEPPPKQDSALDTSSFRSFALTGDKIVFSEPIRRESNPDGTRSSTDEPVDIYDADSGQQIRALERDAPDSLSPVHSRLVIRLGADDGEVAVADLYYAGPNGPSISPIISMLHAETGEAIQRLDDPDMSSQLLGFAFSGGVLAIEQASPENPDTSLVSLFWRDRPQDGGNDVIKGGPGDDRLFGGGGHDRLTGDTGDTNVGFDDFVFDRYDGTDTITDFQIACPDCLLLPGQSVDEIVLLDAAEADIDTVVAGITVDIKGSAVLHYGETDIVLIGIQPGDVSVDWFLPG